MQPSMIPAEKQTTLQRIREFFFAEEVPYGMAIMRMALPLGPLIVMSMRWARARELFSSDGAPAPLWINYNFANLLPIPSGTVVNIMMTVLVICLFTTMIGWRTRLSASLATILYTYINLLDSISTMTKYSVVASHGLLLLSVSSAGAVWSVDSWLKNRKRALAWPGEPKLEQPKFAIWPRRLVQLMIATVYFGAAITKLHTPTFFTGDQLQSWFQTSINNKHPLGLFISQYPALVIIGCYIAVIWEISFIFIAWRGWGRIFALGMGTAFHITTALTLGLFIFPIVTVANYASYISEADIRSLFVRIRRWKRRHAGVPAWLRGYAVSSRLRSAFAATRIPSPVAFATVLAGMAVLGVAAEHKLDIYGIRRPEGKYKLRPVDTDFVHQAVFAPAERIRMIDKIDHLKLGTFLVAGVMSNPRTEFKQGEQMTAQVQLDPVHEDMWVECLLKDADDHTVTTVGQIIPRDLLRANFFFTLGSMLEPGAYQMVVEARGEEMMRKAFTVQPGKMNRAPLAN